MKSVQVIILVLFFVTSLANSSTYPNYYWRDYEGDIPDDAIPVDSSGATNKYIGQVYVKNHGILVGEIFPGIITITTYCQGLHKSTFYNRILCSSNPENLKWEPTPNNLSTSLNFVKGGTEKERYYYIGRIKLENDVKMAKVWPADNGNLELYYLDDDNHEHKTVTNFEILTYSNNCY